MKSEIGLRRATMLFITNDNFGHGQWLYTSVMKLLVLVVMLIICSVLVN